MPRFSSLFTPIRQSLLERSYNPFESFDPFGPLDEERRKRRPVSLPLTAPVGPAGLAETRNRAGDVGRVEGALGRAGILGRERRRPVFDTRLETGVRDFQRRKGLRVDGLLNPGGPTIKALGRVLARPPLKGLSGAAVSANTRLVRHLMTTTADGMVPGLMAADFGTDEAGRAKTADFLSQLFGRDPARARSLRAKARGMMAADEKGLLDKLILQARLADEEDDPTPDEPEDPTPDDPGQDDPEEPPEEPEKPPYDPGHPQPGDPDDPEPEEPEEPDEPPKKPKPDCSEEEEAVAAAQSELEAAEAEQGRINEDIKEKQAALDDLKEQIASLPKQKPAEPGAIGQSFPFRLNDPRAWLLWALGQLVRPGTLNEGEDDSIRRDREKKAEELKKEIDALKEKLKSLESEADEIRQRLAGAEARLAECKSQNR
ncbi:MAG: hypothetical protein IH994_12145 [Proteobacteria bacterium]|nr:hypothetical protein [Pseudomonadota bacterium]